MSRGMLYSMSLIEAAAQISIAAIIRLPGFRGGLRLAAARAYQRERARERERGGEREWCRSGRGRESEREQGEREW